MKKLLFSLIIFIAVFMFGCNKNKTCTIDVENVDVLVGESYELSLNTNVKNPHFVYEIDNNIIEIKDDVIYAKEIGIANVDVSVKNHEGKASFVVRVCQEGLTIFGLHEQVILEHQQLDLVRFGVDEEEHITWRSSNIDVARVSNGEVIPNGLGKTTVTAKTDIYSATFELEIIRPMPSDVETKTELRFEESSKYSIEYNVLPEYALQDVKIISSNDNLIVNDDNTIIASKKGSATLSISPLSNDSIVKVVNVEIFENKAPVFEYTDDYQEELEINYNDKEALLSGIKAIDNVDGDITDKIEFDNNLICTYGRQEITLKVKDNSGNVSTMNRIVDVKWNYHTKFIGHSGSYYGVPNTEAAFLYAAKNLHYQALECDLQVTKDGVYVTNHDSFIDDFVISEHTYAELQEITLTRTNSGYIKSLGLDTTEKYESKVCTLERYLEICKTYGCEAVIEIKGSSPGLSSSSQAGMQKLVDFVKEKGMWDDTIFLTSTVACLKWLRNNGYNDVRCQYLVSSCESQDVLNTCIEYNFDLSTNVTYGGPNSDEWLQKYHDAGLEISVWTFDVYTKYEVGQAWIDKGVEYITCDWYVMEEMNLK